MNDENMKKYKTAAHFILINLHAHIVETYENTIKDRQPSLYIYENFLREILPDAGKPPSLEEIVTGCISVALSSQNIDEAIKTYHENRRVYKRNWFNAIKDEITGKMKPKNPQLLRHYAESIKLVDTFNRTSRIESTVEEIMQEKYLELEDWRSDTTVPITDFFFLAKKPIKTISNAFINDVTYESLIIIKNMFDGSIEGFNVKYPTGLSEHPIFNFRSSYMEFEPELLENELTFFNRYEFEDEDENVHGDIQVQYKPEAQIPANISKRALPKLLKDMQIDLRQKELDMKDREIMTQLFNMINGENLNEQYIICDLRDFTKRVFNIKVPRKSHYEDIASRLQKLRNYDYTITLRSKETGEIIETTSLGLLNYIYINYADNIIQFTPSDQWKRTYVQKKYINILSDSYNTIESVQTKGIMMILQQERLAEFSKNSCSKTLSLKYFRAHMKLQRMGNAALIKELTNHLSILKKEQIVVKDFEFVKKNSAVRIDFMPLEEKELIAYEYNTRSIGTNPIVDVDYKEIE